MDMPLDAIGYRNTHGNHEAHCRKFIYPQVFQEKIKRIANSQTAKMPQRCTPISMLYGMALVSAVGHGEVKRSHFSESGRKAEDKMSAIVVNSTLAQRINHVHSLMPPLSLGEAQAAHARAGGFFSMPLAAANPVDDAAPAVRWDEPTQAWFVEGEEKKNQLLDQMKDFLLSNYLLDQSQAGDLVLRWRQVTAQEPIRLMSIDPPERPDEDEMAEAVHSDTHVLNHIAETCAFEEEIFNSKGLSEGEMYLFKAQTADNLFRFFYTNREMKKPSENEVEKYETINRWVKIFTFGLLQFGGSMLSSYWRKKYYLGKKDLICAERQNRLMTAEFQTFFSMDKPFKSAHGRLKNSVPYELQKSITFNSHAPYFSRAKNSAIEQEILLVASMRDPGTGATQKMLLRPREGGVFETYVPDSVQKMPENHHVIFNKNRNMWYFEKSTATKALAVEMVEGQTLLTLHGKRYPLHPDRSSGYKIGVTKENGDLQWIPVYRDPLSKSWHLTRENHHEVFLIGHRLFFSQWEMEQIVNYQYHAIDNVNPRLYGDGKLIEVRPRMDNVATTPPLYHVIEIGGHLLPVRQSQPGIFNVRYEIFNSKLPMKRGRPIEWDGERWILERYTSPHVSHALSKVIEAHMFSRDISDIELSVPDQKGIQWNNEQHGFLKVRRRYVKIRLGEMENTGRVGRDKIKVVYKNHKFFPASDREFSKIASRTARAERLAELLKDNTAGAGQENVTLNDLQQVFKLMYPDEKAHVDVTSGTELDKKRFVLTSDHYAYVVESCLDGSDVRILEGNDLDMALSKYVNINQGGAVEHVMGVRRDSPQPFVQISSFNDVDKLAAAWIKAGAEKLKRILDEEPRRPGRKLLVGHADFLGTAAFPDNVYCSPLAAYQALIDFFIPLSRENPEAIIIPGSVYTSQAIPDAISQKNIKYQQGNILADISQAIRLFTIQVPVFHGGKLVTIARKGEFLELHSNLGGADEAVEILKNLDIEVSGEKKLLVRNYRKDFEFFSADYTDTQAGILFSGKTFFPGEQAIAEWHFCSGGEDNDKRCIADFFSNQFVIGDEKFLLIVDDEFQKHDAAIPTVRSLAFPRQDQQDRNQYDWIIHSASGVGIDDALRSASYNYLHVDFDRGNEYSSDNVERMMTMTKLEGVEIYDYVPI
jgi:hypothetical protein